MSGFTARPARLHGSLRRWPWHHHTLMRPVPVQLKGQLRCSGGGGGERATLPCVGPGEPPPPTPPPLCCGPVYRCVMVGATAQGSVADCVLPANWLPAACRAERARGGGDSEALPCSLPAAPAAPAAAACAAAGGRAGTATTAAPAAAGSGRRRRRRAAGASAAATGGRRGGGAFAAGGCAEGGRRQTLCRGGFNGTGASLACGVHGTWGT